VWLEFRVLPGPPHSPPFAYISRGRAKGAEFGSRRGGSVSVEPDDGQRTLCAELSLVLGIPFPGNGDGWRGDRFEQLGYGSVSPSIWCCRDHTEGRSHANGRHKYLPWRQASGKLIE